MDEVYLAQVTKLDRKVALKVLPIQLTENKERLMRFEQEATNRMPIRPSAILRLIDTALVPPGAPIPKRPRPLAIRQMITRTTRRIIVRVIRCIVLYDILNLSLSAYRSLHTIV